MVGTAMPGRENTGVPWPPGRAKKCRGLVRGTTGQTRRGGNGGNRGGGGEAGPGRLAVRR